MERLVFKWGELRVTGECGNKRIDRVNERTGKRKVEKEEIMGD